MDSDKDYTVAKEIVQSGQSGEDWDALRQSKGSWPDDERKVWKQYRHFSMDELIEMMKSYERRKDSAAQPVPVVVHAPFQSSEYDGIQDMSTALPRLQLVADLYNKVFSGVSRFVHLAAPAASGKTSLLQLFQRFCGARGVTCIYVSMLSEDFKDELKRETGIDANSWKLENNSCVCADKSKQFVVMLDDAQCQYDDVYLWASLIKGDFQRLLPDNIRFVISATYSFSSHVCPVYFITLPKLILKDFRLSQAEVDEYIRMSSARMGAERAGALLVHPVIRKVLATYCNGHIGTLYVSMREIVKHFCHSTTVTVEEMVSFYLSKSMCSHFWRCYSCGLESLPEQVRACLVTCLAMGQLSVTQYESPDIYPPLVRSGVLEETEICTLAFTSPAAARYINDMIFPHRSEDLIDNVRKRGMFALMKIVLAHMSASTLRDSAVDRSTDMPSEATFQHLMLPGLEAATPASCFICPELSKYFPPSQGHGAADLSPSPVTGRCDYYLNGELRWVIEAMFTGSGGDEPSSRLECEDKYVGLAYEDYLVVDIRVNATGEPSIVRKHERRMSVFFKQGDFSYCSVLCGLAQPVERINLSN